MLGPDIQGKGGVSSVVKGYLESGIMERFGIDYYQTHGRGTKRFKFFFFIKVLPGIIRKMSLYDVVHIHTASWWSFRRKLVIILIAKLLGKHAVIHLHGAKFEEYYHHAPSYEKAVIKYGYSRADKVVVLSNEWRRKISRFCDSEKIVVIPNCISLNVLPDHVITEKIRPPKIILFMGELGQRKGVYDLLDALHRLDIKKGHVQVWLCGDGEMEIVRKKISELGLSHIAKAPGWISGQEKENLLHNAYLYVMPSYFEGLPVSILEALANATPVISTPVGGIPDAVHDGSNGFIVPTGAPEILAERIHELIADEVLWRSFSVNALDTVRQSFSMETLESRLGSLYSSLTGQD